ncbi:cardioactive peptide [Schistocerca nitens]|uniref:cardioactive peptide n=1 Tax=Schistocerca nitens TaxID=7011 RepID=UPI0021196841|nr:cardioactive peptide [Schistocerca nitens]
MSRALLMLCPALLVLLACLERAAADDVIMEKRDMDSPFLNRLFEAKMKRPFCNAFTGCGKKRSDESVGTLLEMNSEPAVADLSRQILSEAKLWEAIQEARAELLARRRQHEMQTNRLADFSRPLAVAQYRKKRAAAPPTPVQGMKPWRR